RVATGTPSVSSSALCSGSRRRPTTSSTASSGVVTATRNSQSLSSRHMQQQTDSQPKVHRFRCPGCGADLQFAPEGGNLTCPYCGREERIEPPAGAVEERSYEEYLQLHADQMGTLAEGALEVACQTCGATVT